VARICKTGQRRAEEGMGQLSLINGWGAFRLMEERVERESPRELELMGEDVM
jgi:hypothetical protein